MYHVAGFADAAAHEAPRPLRRLDGVRRDRIHSVSAGQLYQPNGYDRELQKRRKRFDSYRGVAMDLGQIVRASGRERVCRHLKILVADVPLTQKTEVTNENRSI